MIGISTTDAMRWYLELNATVLVAWACQAAVVRLSRLLCARGEGAGGLSEGATLRLARTTLLAALCASAAVTLLPSPRPYAATSLLFPRQSSQDQTVTAPSAEAGAAADPAVVLSRPLPSLPWLAAAAALIMAGGWRLLTLARHVGQLRRVLQDSYLWRRRGRLRLYLSDAVIVPFSCRDPGDPRQALIVLPRHMMEGQPVGATPLGSLSDLRIALRHEGQHHRSGDTAWLIGLELLNLLLPLNPGAWLWRRTLDQLQEFACDEALIGRGRCSPQAYGGCLIRVTEAALVRSSRLAGTASMAAEGADPGHTQRLLRRRIVMLRRYSALPTFTQRAAALALGLALPLATFSVAYAAKGIKAREPLSRADVVKLVEAMDVTPGFPIVVSDPVVTRLNDIVTDPARSRATREALDRLGSHLPMLSSSLNKYGYPIELLAIPLVESAYQNLPESASKAPPKSPIRSAGLWQITKGTGRNYGLVISKDVDQRLDVPLATDAAMRLLGANRLRFEDWLLSLAAYNQGEVTVERAIAKGGTRSAWHLVEQGHLNNYLVYITAAAILIANPELVE